jgi:ergothioneine biosynthesis protein EgtB
MEDASPTKWHLAHTTWFFETLVLEPALPGYKPWDPRFRVLFNSYYHAIGEPFARPRRGLLTRPALDEVLAWRRRVDGDVSALLDDPARDRRAVDERVEIGIHHEQQHQELVLTDLKHALSLNPLEPAYRESPPPARAAAPPLGWQPLAGGLREIGFAGEGFAFDNEKPRHRVWLEPCEIASRPVTNAEYLDFVRDGGYARPELWLSEGWARVQSQGWRAPLYWRQAEGAWRCFTLAGPRPLDPAEPVCHVSHFEADAYARWAGARLPSEAEWECAAQGLALEGNLAESGLFHPRATPAAAGLAACFGDVWEWTASPYLPYPGFRPFAGALAEYNGKFMSGQLVLRGGSCATPASHLRASYRNFFPPDARWQFSGIRLARDAA